MRETVLMLSDAWPPCEERNIMRAEANRCKMKSLRLYIDNTKCLGLALEHLSSVMQPTNMSSIQRKKRQTRDEGAMHDARPC
jgi:hypothetical protein